MASVQQVYMQQMGHVFIVFCVMCAVYTQQLACIVYVLYRPGQFLTDVGYRPAAFYTEDFFR